MQQFESYIRHNDQSPKGARALPTEEEDRFSAIPLPVKRESAQKAVRSTFDPRILVVGSDRQVHEVIRG